MNTLEVSDLTVRLGGKIVLSDINLTVNTGEFVGLIGPNGAGKTTLLRAILGLLRTASGSVRVAGSSASQILDDIGYVPQRHEFAWDFPISVENAVMTGRTGKIGWFRHPKTADFSAVNEALDRVHLEHLRARPVGELSGGQRQRVLVARALALEPRLLLLDEPFTGLDMPTQELLVELFQELSAENKVVLMATHDLLGAIHECSRLCLINRTVIADGKPEELLDQKIWMRAFNVKSTNPLLKTLGVAS